MPARLISIFLFGVIGSALRLSISAITPTHHYLMIMLINIIGSFLLALATNALPILFPVSTQILSGLSVGLIGSFTTFSTFCVDATSFLRGGYFIALSCYVGLSIIMGLLAARLGTKLSFRLIAGHRHD